MARKLKQEQQYQLARQLWQQGDVVSAEAAFRKVLRKDSTDSAALYDLGVLLLQKGEPSEAADYLKKASLLLPKFAPAFNNLGLAQQGARHYEDALKSFTKALDIDSTYTSALFNRAMLHKEMGAFDAALEDFDAVLRKEPNAIDALVGKGQVLGELQRIEEARHIFEDALKRGAPEPLLLVDIGNLFFMVGEDDTGLQYYERALAIHPKNAKALYQKGLVLLKKKETTAAIDFLVNAAKCDPAFVRAFSKAGILLTADGRHEEVIDLLGLCTSTSPEAADLQIQRAWAFSAVGRFDEALAEFDQALQRHPTHLFALTEKAKLLRRFERIDEAIALLARALEIEPRNPKIFAELGAMYRQGRRFDRAFETFEEGLKIDPDNVHLWGNRGQAHLDLGHWDEAERHFVKASQMDPLASVPKFNNSLIQLLKSNFSSGWDGYELRFDANPDPILRIDIANLFRTKLSCALNADDYVGRSVLLLEEQGIGDSVMFSSVIPDLMKVAKSVAILGSGRLNALYQRSFPGISTYTFEEADHVARDLQFDHTILLGSLCHAYRRTSKAFPARPYFVPNQQKAEAWRARIAEGNKKLIGMSWRGGWTFLNKVGRSLTLRDFLPFITSDDFALVNLQFGDTADEIRSIEEETGRKIHSFPAAELYDLDDLAALMHALDHVVTVQNTNVHICGAIGKGCDALLPHIPEWRYGLQGDHMPWYGSVKLHRREAESEPSLIISKLALDLGRS